MDQLTYTIDTIYKMASYSRVILIVLGIILIAIFYLVWTVHNKLDIALKNQEVLQEEIIDLKELLQGGNGNGTNDERSNQSDLGRG